MLLEITLIAIGLNSTFFTMELNFNLSKLWDLTTYACKKGTFGVLHFQIIDIFYDW